MPRAPRMHNGIIALGSARGKVFGLTLDRFQPMSYLWKEKDTIIISFVASKAKGNFRALVHAILAAGFSVQVPTPLSRMQEIVRKNGYRQSFIEDPLMGETVEVWTLDPKKE